MDTVAIDSGKIRSKQKYLLNTSNVFYIPKIVYVTNHKNKSTMKLGCFNNILQNKYIYKMTSTPQHYTHYLHKVTNSRHSSFPYGKTITMEQFLMSNIKFENVIFSDHLIGSFPVKVH